MYLRQRATTVYEANWRPPTDYLVGTVSMVASLSCH
jgi:hypothetical protein